VRGKPVIATAYSANMDFMNVGNSFPVQYRLVELTKDEGPYQRGSSWADPDVEHAAERMRWVFDHRSLSQGCRPRPGRTSRAHFSLDAGGKRLAARLER